MYDFTILYLLRNTNSRLKLAFPLRGEGKKNQHNNKQTFTVQRKGKKVKVNWKKVTGIRTQTVLSNT